MIVETMIVMITTVGVVKMTAGIVVRIGGKSTTIAPKRNPLGPKIRPNATIVAMIGAMKGGIGMIGGIMTGLIVAGEIDKVV
jgi:hypothetical protein